MDVSTVEVTGIILNEVQRSVIVMMFLMTAGFGFLACVWNLRRKQPILYGFNLFAHLVALVGALWVSGIPIVFAAIVFVIVIGISIKLQIVLKNNWKENTEMDLSGSEDK